MCSPSVLRSALIKQGVSLQNARNNKRLGDVLIECGAITEVERQQAVQLQRLARLQACPLFESLTHSELVSLSQHFDEVSVAAGNTFINEAEEDRSLYVVASGQLELYRAARDGGELFIALVGPGQSLGEMGYFSGDVRTASVRALEAVELLCASYDTLTHYFEDVPRVAHAYVKVVTSRWEETYQRVAEQQSEEPRHSQLPHLNAILGPRQSVRLASSMQQLVTQIIHNAAQLVDADRGSLFLVDKTTGDLISMVAEGLEGEQLRLTAGSGVAGWVASNDEIANIAAASEDKRFNADVDSHTGYQTQTILCAPVHNIQDEVIAVVEVINKRSGSFVDENETQLRGYTGQIGAALDNFDAYRGMMEHADTLEILLSVATLICASPSLSTLTQQLAERVPQIMDCERCEYFVVDYSNDELRTNAATGLNLRFPTVSLPAGYAASAGKTVNISDTERDATFNASADEKLGNIARNLLAVPVFNAEKHIVGVLQIANKKFRPFDHNDELLLRTIAAQLGMAALIDI